MRTVPIPVRDCETTDSAQPWLLPCQGGTSATARPTMTRRCVVEVVDVTEADKSSWISRVACPRSCPRLKAAHQISEGPALEYGLELASCNTDATAKRRRAAGGCAVWLRMLAAWVFCMVSSIWNGHGPPNRGCSVRPSPRARGWWMPAQSKKCNRTGGYNKKFPRRLHFSRGGIGLQACIQLQGSIGLRCPSHHIVARQ